MPDSVPLWISPPSITCRAAAAIVGKTCVVVSADMTGGNPTVVTAGVGVGVLGVAAQDSESGREVLVHAGVGAIVPVTAGAAIAAGAVVESNATGQVITRTTGVPVGRALNAAASGAEVFVRLSGETV